MGTSFNLITVPCHVFLEFDQGVLLFFDCGHELKSESSFLEGSAIDWEPKSIPAPSVTSNPNSKSDPFATSIGSPESPWGTGGG